MHRRKIAARVAALLLLAAGLAGLSGSPAQAAGRIITPDGAVHTSKQLAAKQGLKGHPDAGPTPSPLTTCVSPCYYYNAGYQQFTTTLPTGTYANFSAISPTLDTAHDSHTLAEVDAEKTVSGQLNIVEAGVTVDQSLYGNTQPRLFGYHWVNGVGQGYNGWTDVGGVTPNLGDVISSAQKIGVEHFTSAQATPAGWWMWVGNTAGTTGNWVAYLADTVWSNSGITFTNMDAGQAFGEVAAGETPSSTVCTDMGSSTLATPTTGSSLGSVQFQGISSANTNLTVWENPGGIQNEYNAEALGTPGNIRSFRYGGPGGC